MACDKIRVAGIVPDSITDGPGFRFALFVQGCPRRCEGCHNPTALEFGGGTEMSAEEIFERITSGQPVRGVTFSGGEPFSQAAALVPLAKMVKDAGYELAVYTGYTIEELFDADDKGIDELIALADTIIDGPFIRAKRNLDAPFRGSSNQRILNAKASAAERKAVIETSDRWNP